MLDKTSKSCKDASSTHDRHSSNNNSYRLTNNICTEFTFLLQGCDITYKKEKSLQMKYQYVTIFKGWSIKQHN